MKALKVLTIILLATFSFTAVNAQMRHKKRPVHHVVVVKHRHHVVKHKVIVHHRP